MPNRPKHPEQYLVDQATGCWLWQRMTNGKAGYGQLRVNGRLVLAHRYFYERHRGPIPEGVELDHVVCSNPICCNPWHVEPRTHAQNLRRGRSTKLTDAQVARARGSERASALARELGVTAECIRAIRRGDRWAIG